MCQARPHIVNAQQGPAAMLSVEDTASVRHFLQSPTRRTTIAVKEEIDIGHETLDVERVAGIRNSPSFTIIRSNIPVKEEFGTYEGPPEPCPVAETLTNIPEKDCQDTKAPESDLASSSPTNIKTTAQKHGMVGSAPSERTDFFYTLVNALTRKRKRGGNAH